MAGPDISLTGSGPSIGVTGGDGPSIELNVPASFAAVAAAVAAYLEENPVGEVPTVVHAVGTRTRPSLLGEAADFVTGDSFTADDMPAPVWLTGTSNGKNGLYAKSGSGATRTYTFIEYPEDGTFVWVGADQTEGGDPRLWFLSPQGFAQVYPGVGWLSDLADVDGELEPQEGDALVFNGTEWTARTLPVVPHFAVGVRLPAEMMGGSADFITEPTFVGPPVTALDPTITPTSVWIEQSSNDRDGIYRDIGDAGGGMRTYEFVKNPGAGDLVFVTVDLVDDPIFVAEYTPIGWRLWQVTNIGANLVAPIVPQIDAVATQLDTLAALVGPHGRRPSGHMAWVFGRHDGALTQDGVTDWLEPELDGEGHPVLIDAPESVYDGLPVMRPTASTIGGTSIGASPHTVVALANQATAAHNGIWELFTDWLGVEGIFCVATQSWNDVWFADPDDGPVPGAGTPFIVSKPTPRIAVTVGDGMDVTSVMLAVDAADVTVDVDGITATDVAAAIAELAGGGGGGGPALSDDDPEPLAADADPGESTAASRADHTHPLPSTLATLAALTLSGSPGAGNFLRGDGAWTALPLQLVAQTVTSANAMTVQFTGLSPYKFLVLMTSARGTESGTVSNRSLAVQFNGDTGANYNNGTSAGTTGIAAQNLPTAGYGYNAIGLCLIDNNAAGVVKHLVGVGLISASQNVNTRGGLWNNTADLISTIELSGSGSNEIAAGASFVLLGVPR